MKNIFGVLLLIVLTQTLSAQDEIYTVNNWGGTSNPGITKHSINPATGAVSSSTSFATTPDAIFNSEALAINSSGWLYSIPLGPNTGNFNVYSVDASAAPASAPTTPALTGTIPSGGIEVYFRRLGVAPNGYAYMIVSSADNILYFARFQTHSDGTATNFQNLGTMTLSDGAATGFHNGDLIFDGNGNLFALVNHNSTGGTTKIYKIDAATVAGANASSQIQLNMQGTVKTGTAPNFADFGGVVTGLALASNGNLYLSSQSPSAGLYLISKDNTTGTIIATLTNYSSNPGLGDIAGGYQPTDIVLPVKYKTINARILNDELQISWITTSETNNDRFDIEVSKDGSNFVKIATVKSKATNGISNKDIEYQFSASLTNVAGVIGLGVFALAFLSFPVVKRRNRLMLSLVMIVGILVFAVSCNKSQDQIDTDNNDKVFVRLVRYNIDGKKEVSKVVTAYKTN